MCPTWSDVVPEDVEARCRELPRAYYAKAFVHCLSFPRHCAFQLHSWSPDSCAFVVSTCPLLAFFFSSPTSRLPFFSFFLSSSFYRVLAISRYLPWTCESFLFFLSFRCCILYEHTAPFLVVTLPDACFLDSCPFDDARSSLTAR